MEGLIRALKTDPKKGLTPSDFTERDAHFGNNHKDPPQRTRKNKFLNFLAFCSLFIGALDDLMLKVLLVCAVISIGVEMGFADAKHLSTGKPRTVTVSLDRRYSYPLRCFPGLHRNGLERLQKGRAVPQTDRHQR